MSVELAAQSLSMPSFFKWDMKSRYDTAKEKEQVDAIAWKAVCKIVDARDKRICRACGRRSELDAIGLTKRGHRHHFMYRSAGGSDVSENLVTLCAECHGDEHMHRLYIRGEDANSGLEFWRKNGSGPEDWYLSRREIGPHIVEKD